MSVLALPADAISLTLGQLTLHLGVDEAVVCGPGGRPEAVELPGDPEALREFVRYDAAGRYRPLSGAKNLRPDWHARFHDLATLDAALDAIYPLAQTHVAQWESGDLRVVPLDEVLRRQTGRYEVAAKIEGRGREIVRAVLCGCCVRVPVWAREAPAEGQIPCPEACSVFVSLAREAALWQADRPSPATVDREVPFAAFETPGNLFREAYLALEGVGG